MVGLIERIRSELEGKARDDFDILVPKSEYFELASKEILETVNEAARAAYQSLITELLSHFKFAGAN